MKCDTVAMHCKERNLNVDENQGIMWFCLLKICWTFVVHIPMLAINHKVEKQEYMQPTNTVHHGNILLLRQVWTSWKAQTRPISSPAVTGPSYTISVYNMWRYMYAALCRMFSSDIFGFMLPLSLYSSSPQHIEECCGWLRQKLNDLNEEQRHVTHQHQEQVRLSVM